MLALCSVVLMTYFAQNYAGIKFACLNSSWTKVYDFTKMQNRMYSRFSHHFWVVVTNTGDKCLADGSYIVSIVGVKFLTVGNPENLG